MRQTEQTTNTVRRKTRRKDPHIRTAEQFVDTTRKQALRDPSTTPELISRFHAVIGTGPVFICSSCDQLHYKHSVQNAASLRSLSVPVIPSVLLNKVSHDGIEYVCNTCGKYLRKNQTPPCAIVNNLLFPEIPSYLPVLTVAEWCMLSPRLAFMQIHESAVGKQLRIHGNVVCVPADVCTTVNMLPRTSCDLETVAIQLKRRSQYQHAVLSSNVRPACIREVGQYLVQCPLFQQEHISFSDSLLNTVETV